MDSRIQVLLDEIRRLCHDSTENRVEIERLLAELAKLQQEGELSKSAYLLVGEQPAGQRCAQEIAAHARTPAGSPSAYLTLDLKIDRVF